MRPEWWSSDEWSTPQETFDQISAKHGPFDLDACCREETAKADCFYTKEDDALTLPWYGRVWVNPPYSRPKDWCKKAVEEIQKGNATKIVMLLPAAVDTNWFHDYVLGHAEVEFIRGRIKFIGWEGTPIGSPKSGNVLAVYTR
jgi:phage N-6-adenine-methyltransferase